MTIDENELFEQLNSTSNVVPAQKQLPPALSKDEQRAEEDFEYTREKLKNIIEQSEPVLEHAADIATETGEPRSIEVYATLMKNLGDIAKAVMETNKTKSAIDKDRGVIKNPALQIPADGGSITQNNQTIFVGTTKELHQMLRDMANEPIEGEVVPDKG